MTTETLILNAFFSYFFSFGESFEVLIAYALLIVIFFGFLYVLTKL